MLILGAGKWVSLRFKPARPRNRTGYGDQQNISKRRSLPAVFRRGESLNELQCALMEADILISSTGASGYVVTKR
ncbi:hypothetical protein PO124_23180 [Bacillus licheniformis]|nr:hypothetical protein [Bacillus licheniformis]